MYVSRRTLYFLFAASLVCGVCMQMEAGSGPTIFSLRFLSDTRKTVNTHPLARPEFDRGEAPPTLAMNRMLLVLKRSPQQEAALSNFLAALQDKRSASFHRWLTPDQFAEQFGPSAAEVQSVTYWLESQGFHDIRPSRGRITVEFSGTAQQVQSAFRTSIHRYVVNGEEHWANASDPVIPAAFSDVVAGIASLHNFRPKPTLVMRPDRAVARISGEKPWPQVNFPDGSHALSPRDFDAIYDVDALGWEANGITIAVVSDSNINVQNVANFRSLFGNPNPPTVTVNGIDPGQIDPTEPTLDVSWAGGIAMNATIDLVVSQQTNATSGLDLSEQYIVDNNLADIVTESYSDCEADLGSAEMQFLSSIRQQAASQGITFIVSAGDNGSAGCDSTSEETASGPLSVNGRASSPYDVAVGGTQFNESICPVDCWGNTETLVTASGYVPEDVWNESCIDGDCPSSVSPNIFAGSGGASAVFRKPTWQRDVGVPDDGARDVPDVSFSSSVNHDPYVVCLQSTDCVPNVQGGVSFHLIGGTSAAAPSFAGIVAQLVESNGSRLGQINPALYALEWQDALTDCNGSTNVTNANTATCNFNDVTVGNNSVPGQSGYDSSSAPYQAGRGYDLATGLGSVNASRLIQDWDKNALQRTTTTLSVSPQSNIAVGAPIWLTVTVNAVFGGGPPTGQVAVSTPAAAAGTDVAYLQLSNGTASRIVNSGFSFPFGNYALTANYMGDGTYAPSSSNPVNVSFINVLNGCTPTLFTYSPGPINSNGITASGYVQADAPCGYDIRVGGPDGTLFSTTAGYSDSYAENWVTNGMTFYMQEQGNTTPQGTMASLVVTFGSSDSCVVTGFSATPLDHPVWEWSPGTTISVNADCAFDVREGGPSGPLVGSGDGVQSYTIPVVPDGTIFCLQPQGDTNVRDTLSIVEAHTPSMQQQPVMPFCAGPDKRYCY